MFELANLRGRMTKVKFSIRTVLIIDIIAIAVMLFLGAYAVIFPSEAAAVSATVIGILVELGFVAIYAITERLLKIFKNESSMAKIFVSMLSLFLIILMTATAFGMAGYSAGLTPVIGGYVGAWFIYLVEDVTIK